MKALWIKEKRKTLGITQEQLAKLIGVSKRTIINYEKGEKIPDTKSEILHKVLSLEEHNKNADDLIINTNGNKFEQKTYGFNLTVNLLPFDGYASYCESLEDVLIAYDFEQVTFNVDQYGHGNYMAFKIKGDSMNGGNINDTMDGALVLGRELGRHHWLDGFSPTDFGWVILSKENIYHKDITDLDKSTGDIICSSRNPDVDDFKVNLNDVYQIFKVIKRIQ